MNHSFTEKVLGKDATQSVDFHTLVQSHQFYDYLSHMLSSLTSERKTPVHLILLHGAGDLQVNTSLLDGNQLYVNTDNDQIRSLVRDENKITCILGYLFHEIAHLKYMDFRGEMWAANSFKLGNLPFEKETMLRMKYPHPDFMEVKKNTRFAKVLTSLYRDIAGVISDYHDEEALCRNCGSLVKKGIETVREVQFTTLRSLEDLTEDVTVSTLALLLSAILQYCRFGRVFTLQSKTDQTNVIMEMLDRIKGNIHQATTTDDVKEKYIQINLIVNNLWRYVDLYIDGPSSAFALEGTEEEDYNEYRAEGERGFHQMQEEEEEDCDNCNQDDENKEESPGGDESAMDGSTDQADELLEALESAMASSGGDNISNLPVNILQNGLNEIQDSSSQESYQPSDNLSGTEEGTMVELALENLQKEVEKEQEEERRSQEKAQNTLSHINSGNYGSAHTGIQADFLFIRPDLRDKDAYEEVVKQDASFIKKVKKEIIKVMQEEASSLQRRRIMGRSIDTRHLYKVDQRYFKRKKNPEKQLDMAVAILIDNSGSMKGLRIESARKAAILLQEVLESLEIQTLLSSHNCQLNPVVEIYQQFEDRKIAKYALMKMSPAGNNRDGLAIRMVGDLLGARPEKDKLFIIISDGQPNSNGYSGDLARQDMKEALRMLKGQGIKTIAFAIGEDKAQIKAIYNEAFIDISDYDKFPALFANFIQREIIANIQ